MSAYSLQRLSNIKLYKKLEVPAGMTWVYFFTTESNVFQRDSDHLLYYDETFLSWWEWSLLRWQCFQPRGRTDHWVVWWTIKMIWLLRSASTYGKFELLDGALLHHHQNKQNILERLLFHPSVRVPKSPRISLKPVVVALVVDLFIIWAESRF